MIMVSDNSGADLLDQVEKFLARFIIYPDDHAKHAHTLWIAHTFLMDHWESTPRIAFLSPEPGSGKTRALEVTEHLVNNAILAFNATTPYLFRKIDEMKPHCVVLFDEIDTVFGPKARDNEELRGLINAGHRRAGKVGRVIFIGKKGVTKEYEAYCAVALAGLKDLPDTIMTRSIVIRMKRRAIGEKVSPWRERINKPEALELHDQLEQWATTFVRNEWPDMPDGVEDRAADLWEALISLADHAKGHWPTTARNTAISMVADSRSQAYSLGVQLLHDIKIIFEQRDHELGVMQDRIKSEVLVNYLAKIKDAPWGEVIMGQQRIDQRSLAVELKAYGITPKVMRFDAGGGTLRGYQRKAFFDAWERYPPLAKDDDHDENKEDSENRQGQKHDDQHHSDGQDARDSMRARNRSNVLRFRNTGTSETNETSA